MTRRYERHPLSAKYQDITGQAWEDFKENVRQFGVSGRTITIYEGKVLDGWQLYRACLETGVVPKFQPLPHGVDPLAFVETWNDHRRHEPPDVVRRRADERRQRVASKRAEGKSIRSIAQEEGVSKTQIVLDLKDSSTSGVQPCTPEGEWESPENGTGNFPEVVTGRDGKEYPAIKPQPVCDRCRRVGPTMFCPACEDLRKPARNGHERREEPAAPPAPDVVTDDFGTPVPERLVEDFRASRFFKNAYSKAKAAAEAIQMVEASSAYQHYERAQPQGYERTVYSSWCATSASHMHWMRPSQLCPDCRGVEASPDAELCVRCKGLGWLCSTAVRDDYARGANP